MRPWSAGSRGSKNRTLGWNEAAFGFMAIQWIPEEEKEEEKEYWRERRRREGVTAWYVENPTGQPPTPPKKEDLPKE